MDKLFLIEKGHIVVVRDGAKEVGFSPFDEFYKYYPGLDLTGKWYVDYEPERNLYIDSVLNINGFEVVPEYDAVIAAIDNLLEKKNDPFFGKTPEEIQEMTKQSLIQAVQIHLDATARTRGYDGILSAASYATSTNATFRSEGQACVVWRDSVWATCYQIMADVLSGTRPVPTIPEILAELPEIIWPQ